MTPQNQRRVAVLLGTPVLVALAFQLGVVDSLKDPSSWRVLVAQHAVVGAVLYVVAHALAAAAGIPSVVFLVPATLIFPKFEALVLGMAGAMLGSYIGFALARSTFRSWVEPRVPARLRRWDEAIAKNELMTVTTIRLTFFLLPPVAWALGLTKVRTGPYLLGTFFGTLPGVVFFTYAGGSFFGWLASQPLSVWLAFGVGVGAFIFYRRRKRLAEDSA